MDARKITKRKFAQGLILVILLFVTVSVSAAQDWGNPKRAGDLGFYGWRARLGVIFPMSYRGTPTQLEFNQLKPVGTDMVVENVKFGQVVSEEAVLKMNESIVTAAIKLKESGVDSIVYASTAATFIKGPEYERQLVESMKAATGLPCATVTGAVMDAFTILKMKKIILVTRYPEPVEKQAKVFFKECGFEIVSAASDTSYKFSSEMADAHPGLYYRLARQAFVKGADGIFISGGNVRTIEIIDIMEKDFGLPVVSSNLASIWKGLRMAGVNERIPGYGKLLAEY